MQNLIAKTSPNQYTVFNTERRTTMQFFAKDLEAERIRVKFNLSVIMPKEYNKFKHVKNQ